jgi:hypothetical protein
MIKGSGLPLPEKIKGALFGHLDHFPQELIPRQRIRACLCLLSIHFHFLQKKETFGNFNKGKNNL